MSDKFRSNDDLTVNSADASQVALAFFRTEIARAVRGYFRPILSVFENPNPPLQTSTDSVECAHSLKAERVELRGYALRKHRR